jgi:hypothetical protein
MQKIAYILQQMHFFVKLSAQLWTWQAICIHPELCYTGSRTKSDDVLNKGIAWAKGE